MRKIRELLTPENVFIEYELAGLGSRTIAFVIDTLIQLFIIAIIVVGIILSGMNGYTMNSFNSILIALGGILVFIVFFGYYIIFELLMNGQSPGKRFTKLRVIKQTGEPLNFFESFLRNLLRLIDIYFTSFILGPLLIMFTKDYKRVGDFAANTIVVKVKNTEKLVTVEDLFEKAYSKNGNDVSDNKYNNFPVSEYEYSVLKEYMERKIYLGNRGMVFEYNLNKYFAKKFGITNDNYNPNNFFEAILKVNGN